MPCGGIDKYNDVHPGDCFYCSKPDATHYCHEWDCMLHADCIIPFLETEEGKIVIKHGHTVTIWFQDSTDSNKVEKV
jgi:hypothetical protein